MPARHLVQLLLLYHTHLQHHGQAGRQRGQPRHVVKELHLRNRSCLLHLRSCLCLPYHALVLLLPPPRPAVVMVRVVVVVA